MAMSTAGGIGRKGMFFTIIAFALIGSFVIGYQAYEYYAYQEESHLVETRVNTINTFIGDLERDLERSLFISSFRSLLGLSQHVTRTGEFIGDFDAMFAEIVLNGTINGSYTNLTKDSYFYEWVSRVEGIGQNLNILASFSPPDVSVFQDTPWSVRVDLNTTLTVQDSDGMASWQRDERVSTTVSVIDFEDPLYSVLSNKRIINTIRQTPYDDFTDGDNVTNLVLHMEGSYYRQTDYGPSFLMRFAGNLSNDPAGMGIESMINYDDLLINGFPTNRSIIDHVYWRWPNITADHYHINHTSFMLDNISAHLTEYEADHLAYR
ncbi:hypothetical protein JXB02_00935 [Candidatus Woesearchaeota archaeon]|nr:hypothetical protein [Candidatus Woesearchaeota archaeon]